MERKQLNIHNLWQQYKYHDNLQAREKIIEEYIPLVQYIAGRVAIHLPDNVEFQDLLSYGFFGLMDAVDKFDLERDIKFETYASLRIRGGIIDGLRSTDWIPRSVRTKAKQVDKAIIQLEKRFKRTPSDGEVAEALNLNIEKYYQVLDEIRSINLLSLDDSISSNDDSDSIRLIDLVDDQGPEIDHNLIDEEIQNELALAIKDLNNQEQLVISLYYHEGLTLKEIGHVLEVSESRVSQIHSKAIRILRSKLKFT